MTKKEFKQQVEAEGKYNVYSVKRITENYNGEQMKGWKITYSMQLNENTQTTEKEVDMWYENLEDVANKFPHN